MSAASTTAGPAPAAGPLEPPPIALRIVVDGASTAGKTTTARALGERLGRPVVTPEEEAGRTLLFDWMDHVGGRSDGRAIRTQVVAVPGHLPHLRARLLVTADVVLFVADTSAPGIDDSCTALAQVHELLRALPAPRPGLLVQANKRDHPEALPLAEVRRRLGLADDDLLIETVATEGEGVRQSFVYAVRLGLQHVRAVDGPRVAERQQHAEDLLAQLDTDPRPTAERLAAADLPGEGESDAWAGTDPVDVDVDVAVEVEPSADDPPAPPPDPSVPAEEPIDRPKGTVIVPLARAVPVPARWAALLADTPSEHASPVEAIEADAAPAAEPPRRASAPRPWRRWLDLS